MFPHFPSRTEVEEPLLRAIIARGGQVRFSRDGRDLEIELADYFRMSRSDRDYAAQNYKSEGNRAWRNEIQFVRAALVKRGDMGNAVRDRWDVTDQGYKRCGVPKQEGRTT